MRTRLKGSPETKAAHEWSPTLGRSGPALVTLALRPVSYGGQPEGNMCMQVAAGDGHSQMGRTYRGTGGGKEENQKGSGLGAAIYRNKDSCVGSPEQAPSSSLLSPLHAWHRAGPQAVLIKTGDIPPGWDFHGIIYRQGRDIVPPTVHLMEPHGSFGPSERSAAARPGGHSAGLGKGAELSPLAQCRSSESTQGIIRLL